MNLNTSVWGTGIEVNPYEDKLDENKVYYATTSERPSGDDENYNKSQTYTLDRLEADGKIICGQDFDLSPCYIMVDENCPWTKSVSHQFIRVDNTNSSKRLDVGIMNENKAVPVMIGTGYVRPASNDNYCLNCSNSSSSYSGSIGMPYFMFNGWKNNRRLTNDRITQYSNQKYKTLPSVNGANFQPFVKFGGKSIIARIYVRAKGSTGSYQDYSLYDYCYTGTTYTDKNKVLCVYYDAQIIINPNTGWSNKHGGAWSGSLTGTYITAVPFTSDYTFDVNESVNFTASTWDIYLNDYNKPCLFGTFSNSITLSSLKNYFNSIDIHSSYEKRTSSPYILDAITENDLWGTSDDFYEYFMKSSAYLGLFFTPYNASDMPFTVDNQDEMFTDEKMFCGIIDENGITHGEYTHGTDNENQVQFTSTDLQKDSNVKPSGGGGEDPNTYDPDTHFNTGFSLSSAFNTQYVLSAGDVDGMARDFFDFPTTTPEDADYLEYSNSTFMTNNPIDTIVSLKWYPVPIPYNAEGGQHRIKLGNYETVGSGYYLSNTVGIYSFDPVEIFPFFSAEYGDINNPCFLDYEPYTTMQLTIPYCGTVNILPSIYMGHSLNITMVVDFLTGGITAYILKDNTVMDSITGYVAVDIAISSIQKSTLDGQLYNANQALKNAKIGMASSVLNGAGSMFNTVMGAIGTGGTGGKSVDYTPNLNVGANTFTTPANVGLNILSSFNNLHSAEYNLKHTQIPYGQIGSASSLSGAMQEQTAVLTITRPKISNDFDPEKYGHSVGYPCIKTGTINDFIGTGFTIFQNIDLSGIKCSLQEKEMIMSILKSGVIL